MGEVVSNTYFIADLHLGHEKVAGYRGFDAIEEHDETVIAALNEATKHDTIWVLGDVCSGSRRGFLHALGLLEQVQATMHLITGNHDPCWPGNRESYKWQQYAMSYFRSVQAFARVRLVGEAVLMSHFPYTAERNTPTARHLQYRLQDQGLPLIHGHTHAEHPRTSPREVCVSWEAWNRLAPAAEIVELLGLEES